MRFYIPEWNDQVDPDYNFNLEQYSQRHKNVRRSDHFMWEIFPKNQFPFDGVLVSLMKLFKNQKAMKDIAEMGGLRNYLRLPERIPLFADCGAWGYIQNEEEGPPFQTEEIFKHYDTLGVEEAVTIDHLVLPQFKRDGKIVIVDTKKRMDITYRNGIEGYNLWKNEYKNKFNLLVAVQGLETSDYIKMFDSYVNHGIKSFAFGGLAKKTTEQIQEILNELFLYITENKPTIKRIHFFGLGREILFSSLDKIEKIGIDVSFDTSSWLRQAFTGGKYVLVSDNVKTNYISIRVPSETSFKGDKALADKSQIEFLKDYETQSMNSILDNDHREYPNNVYPFIKKYANYIQKENIRSIHKKSVSIDNNIIESIEQETILNLEDKEALIQLVKNNQNDVDKNIIELIELRTVLGTTEIDKLILLVRNNQKEFKQKIIELIELRTVLDPDEKEELNQSITKNQYNFEKRIKKMTNYYLNLESENKKVLNDKPWEKCNCVICKKHGIQVLVFRGNNRNRRRGFHNIYQIYNNLLKKPETWGQFNKQYLSTSQELSELKGNILVLTGCSKTKVGNTPETKLEADKLYIGSLFMAVKKFASVNGYPLKIISAKYGLVDSNQIIEGYDKIIKYRRDVLNIQPQVTEKILEHIDNYDKIIVIAGTKYRETLENVWNGKFIYLKAGGLGLMTQIVNKAFTQKQTPPLSRYLNK
jgi:hypothetical protein